MIDQSRGTGRDEQEQVQRIFKQVSGRDHAYILSFLKAGGKP